MRTSGASHLFSYAEGEAQLFLPPSHRVAGQATESQLLWWPLSDVRARLWRDQKVSLVEALPYLGLMLPVQGALSCHGAE